MRWLLFAMLTVVTAVPVWGQTVNCTTTPRESKHVAGPHGLEGWTLDSSIPDSPYGNECFSLALVIARNGQVIRRIKADPILWNWIFWKDGQQAALLQGPFHFVMVCTLLDIKSGKTLSTYDCFHKLPTNAPNWVKAVNTMN